MLSLDPAYFWVDMKDPMAVFQSTTWEVPLMSKEYLSHGHCHKSDYLVILIAVCGMLLFLTLEWWLQFREHVIDSKVLWDVKT